MCNRQVQFLIGLDKQQRLAYAPLQGKTAQQIWAAYPELKPAPGESFKSMIVARDLETDAPKIWQRSDAALEIASEVGGLLKLATVLRVIPRKIRDMGYNFIASNRYRWSGKVEECMWDPNLDASRFLD